MTAFARADLDAGTWWAEFSPFLSPSATVAYEGTDPELVPVSAVTGAPLPTPAVSPYLATVRVPTDAGQYAVLLVREGAGAPWLVERITPVETAAPAVPEDVAPVEPVDPAEPGSVDPDEPARPEAGTVLPEAGTADDAGSALDGDAPVPGTGATEPAP
jgi:hypothetical protein